VHYLYLFGKLPAKIHYEERSAEYYKEIDKMEKTAEEIRFIGKYDIQSKSDIEKIKSELIENVSKLKENKEKVLKDYIKADDIDKENIQTEIENITVEITKITEDIKIYKRIIYNAERGEKEQILIEQRKNKNLQNSKKDVKKKDNRIR